MTQVILNTISQLPKTETFYPNSLIEVSEVVSSLMVSNETVNVYQSKKIEAGKVSETVYDSVMENLSNNHGLKDGIQFDKMQQFIDDMLSGSSRVLYGTHTFNKAPMINEDLMSFNFLYEDCAVNVKSLKRFEAVGNSLLINSDSSYATQYMNVEDNLYPDKVKVGIEHAPSVEAERHNVYLFMINGRESNVWIAPADGMLVCYGWVDEEDPDSEASNVQRWIALEANFKQKDGLDNWKILQLQPVIPNAFCSYVSFSFPVNKGLELRLESGFTVGTNSNKYNSIQGSMTNHLANAFVGGIYSKYNIIT